MKNKKIKSLFGLLFLSVTILQAQNVKVDVNVDIEHSVGGVSDFGRERHITMHSNLYENDWSGELDKAKYLIDDLDVYFGRDNGTASFLFNFTPADNQRSNKHDRDSLSTMFEFWQGFFGDRLVDEDRVQFKDKIQSMIMGTNPHPTYPTLSYRHPSGSTWGRENNSIWIPQDIETSAEWMVQYLDEFFVEGSQKGQPMPKYWEVVNEPDFLLNTGGFMMSSWEDIWKYHSLVAKGIKQKLGNRAPKIGGMTWGSHDLFGPDAFSRFKTVDYVDNFYGDTPADEPAKAYARSQVQSQYIGQNGPWFQWDVMWKGFMDTAGQDMDFYSVHLYDWPTYDGPGGVTRSGGHVEATLELLEWYDVSQNGAANRKPVVISEYGAVKGAWDFKAHDARYDWEIMKPFSSMMMQFLERPDYIELSMPFTPIKAQWGDTDTNGDGTPEYFYQYKMMRDDDGDGNWEWSDYIKWFELWSEVDGTRVDTKSTDPDIQVDSYINGNEVFLILNNLEPIAKNIDLNLFGNTPNLQSVSTKHLYLSGVSDIRLDRNTANAAPNTVALEANATMILKYAYASNININQDSVERKFFGDAVSANQRTPIQAGDNTFFVKGVKVPSNADQAEAMLKVTANLFNAPDDTNGFLSIVKLTVNGIEVEAPLDWRGGSQERSRWFGTLEIPVPANLLQTDNMFVIDFKHTGEVSVVNLVTWEFTKKPGRSDEGTVVPTPNPIAVAGLSITPSNSTLNVGQTAALTATVTPANASNKAISWSSNNTAIATVNATGVVTARAAGSAVVTATSIDGSFNASATITVNAATTPNPNPNPVSDLIIEAEDFVSTGGGTFDDAFVGGPGLGVNRLATSINYVNRGDWAEYSVNVPAAGTYSITYQISTPSNNAQIELLVNGTSATVTNVPNNGQWDSFTALNGGTVSLQAGVQTIRINASSAADWQWNLDKIILSTGAAKNELGSSSNQIPLYLFPNPTTGNVKIHGLDSSVEHAISINDIKGAQFMRKKLDKSHTFNMESLPAGIYFLTVLDAQNGNRTLKLVKN